MSPDGTRFLRIELSTSADDGARPDLVVVTHWFEELKGLVPVN